jgi:hypothetical protein
MEENLEKALNERAEIATHIYAQLDTRIKKLSETGKLSNPPTTAEMVSLTQTLINNLGKDLRVETMMDGTMTKTERDTLLKRLHENMNRYPDVQIEDSGEWIIVKKNGEKMDSDLFESYRNDLKTLGFRWNKNAQYWEIKP